MALHSRFQEGFACGLASILPSLRAFFFVDRYIRIPSLRPLLTTGSPGASNWDLFLPPHAALQGTTRPAADKGHLVEEY